MVRVLLSLMFALLLGTMILASGCKENEPMTELEKFVARTETLDGQALDDTLRAIAGTEPPYSVYANYVLGNRFYEQAGDSSRASGWESGAVTALMDSAEVYFTKCVEQDTTFIEALVNLGSLWDDRAQAMGARHERDLKLNQARKWYLKALDVDPTDEKALCNLGSLHLAQQKKGQALQAFQKALEHNPDSALAHYNLAIMFAESKIYREAVREWEAAVDCDPDGDIGERSRANIKIVQDLMNAPDPSVKQ